MPNHPVRDFPNTRHRYRQQSRLRYLPTLSLPKSTAWGILREWNHDFRRLGASTPRYRPRRDRGMARFTRRSRRDPGQDAGLERARESQVSFPATVSTPYVNSIPREQEPWFPGDEHIERRIRAYIRWNAAVMVVRANSAAEGIGGHLSTFASSASLYEVGFNHFFRGTSTTKVTQHRACMRARSSNVD
ncbi:MAG: pyruvate dehydrogenase component [Actinomycetota bacterium]